MPKHPQPNPTPRHIRIVSRGDGYDVHAIGRSKTGMGDLYADLLQLSWQRMLALLAAIYLALNLLFALAYYAEGDGILTSGHASFLDAFFFSVQTLATIGYGTMSPHGIAANLLVTVEAMVGFAYFGLVTGLMFSKFSRPTARVMFSHNAVIAIHNGQPHFMLRVANERANRIVNAHAKLTLMRDEKTLEGQPFRRFYDIALTRSEIPFLQFTWTLFHRIDEDSPLFGMNQEKLAASETEIIVSLTGLDETFSQTVHARHSYIAGEILCNAHFADIINRRDGHILEIHYGKFHDVVPNSESPLP